METKKMAFAGSWYPSDSKECEKSISGFLAEKKGPLKNAVFRGGIVPHAGWYFSGSIACRVIASLKAGLKKEEKIDTILLFGAHMHRQSEPFIMGEGAVETPFGEIETDDDLTERICSAISIRKRSPFRFPDENTFELQYPFIKYFFPESKIVICAAAPSNFAMVIGRMAVEEAGKLSRSIRIIGSTDMTHYGPDFAFTPRGTGVKAVEWVKRQNDENAIHAMMTMDETGIISQGLDNKSMCCAGAVAAAVSACRTLGCSRSTTLDYATSYDKTGGSSFVGYSGILYH